MAASALLLCPCHVDEEGFRPVKEAFSFSFTTTEIGDSNHIIQDRRPNSSVYHDRALTPSSSSPSSSPSPSPKDKGDLHTATEFDVVRHVYNTMFSFRLCKLPITGSTSLVIKDLVDEVKLGLHAHQIPKLASEGSGGVYFMKDECGLTNVGVFKPMDEEPMAVNNPRGFCVSNHGEGLKKGSRSGEGALREVAAYILDHPASHPNQSNTRSKNESQGFSGVPPTTMIECYHSSFHYALGSQAHINKAKKGSLQRFVHALSSCEDMGYSQFPLEEVHKISVLDLRLANTDRNAGNILICKGSDGGLKLVPIDHGYCLPTKFEDCTFEWLYWPQAKEPYGDSTLSYIQSLDAEEDIMLLRKSGWRLGPQIARVFRVSTMLLKKGAAAGLTPFEIGSIMSRVESFDTQSPIEVLLEKAEALLPIHGGESDFLGILASLLDDYIMLLKTQ